MPIEEKINAELSFLTLFKYVLKKWLLIGFLTAAGALFGALYAMVLTPLTKDVYRAQFNVLSSRTIVGGVSSENNFGDSVVNYVAGEEFRADLFASVKVFLFADETDKDDKKLLGKFNASVVTGKADKADKVTNLFVIGYGAETAAAVAAKGEEIVKTRIDALNEQIPLSGGEATAFVALDKVSLVKVDATALKGLGVKIVTESSRVNTIAAFCAGGFIAGAALAVVLYFFNGKVNSVNMLECAGMICLAADSSEKDVYDRAAAKLLRRGGAGGSSYAFVSVGSKDSAVAAEKELRERFRAFGYKAETVKTARVNGFGANINRVKERSDFALFAENADDAAGMARAAEADVAVLCVNVKKDKIKSVVAAAKLIEAGGGRVAAVAVNPSEGFVY